MSEHLTKEEATAFFAEVYGGEHHIPDYKVREWGFGWCVHHYGELSTFDYSKLTTLVLMAHEKCIRVSIGPHAFKTIRIAIWKRKREGGYSERHPDIDTAIQGYEKHKSTP